MAAKPGLIITVLYKKSPELQFNLEYYLSHHIPLATKIWQPRGMIDGYVTQPTDDSEFAYGVTMNWTNLEAWQEATKNEAEMEELMGDVKNFTNEKPIFVIGKVIS